MATLRDIRNRIKGVQSTQKITKAMKMVAAARLRRAQENVISARPYAKKIEEFFDHLITDEHRASNPLLIKREVKNILIVAVTADRGLCGSFNTNIIKEVQRLIIENQKPGVNVKLFTIGKKGQEFFKKRKYDVCGEKTGFFSHLSHEHAQEITKTLIAGFLNGQYDEVKVVYNEFKSIVSQKITVKDYLPIPVHSSQAAAGAVPDYIYEKDQASIFEYILPKFIFTQMWRILLESNASELGAKMTAMDNATTNAGELIRSLKVTYNKERQAAITTEILEIVSGANALKGNGG
jgi:F-type H+-transporting ATPase subunit gamma